MKLAMLLALTLTALACSSYGAEPLALDVRIAADKLDTVSGDSISFEFNAQGGRLEALRIDWGDGTALDESALSARTMLKRVKHAYGATGTFEVKATIHDSFAGQKTSSLSVRIR